MSSTTVTIRGVRINRLSYDQVLNWIDETIATDARRTIVFPNPFCIIEANRRPEYKAALNDADMRLADGTPLVWASRWLGAPVPERVCGPDLFVRLNARAEEKGYRVFLLGGAIPRNAERVGEALQKYYPRLNVVGTASPPAGPIEGALLEDTLAEIRRAAPDVLWIGLGSPMQEEWISRHRRRIDAKVTLAVGGTFNYYNGTRRRAPQWMCDNALEWTYRIYQDPSLIWKKRFYQFATHFFLPVMLDSLFPTRRRGQA